MEQRARYEGVKCAAGIIFRLTGSSQTWNGESLLWKLPNLLHSSTVALSGRNNFKNWRKESNKKNYIFILFRDFFMLYNLWIITLMNIFVNKRLKYRINKRREKKSSIGSFVSNIHSTRYCERWKRKRKRPVEKWRRVAIAVSVVKIYHSPGTPGGTYFSF